MVTARDLNEKFNALIQIASALGELHEQGIYHGDFKGGTNIRNHKKRGCVFIDPEPHTPGSLSTIAGDLSDLAELIERLLPDYASRYFKKTFQRLKANDYTAKDAAVDLTAVRDSRHLPGNLDQIKLDAANYSAKRAKTDQQYKRNRENRAAAIERLKENIDAIACHYPGLTTTLHPFDANREMKKTTLLVEDISSGDPFSVRIAAQIILFLSTSTEAKGIQTAVAAWCIEPNSHGQVVRWVRCQ